MVVNNVLKDPKNEIKSKGVPKFAVTSGMSIHQNVCID